MKVYRTVETAPQEYRTVVIFEGTEAECLEYEVRCFEMGISVTVA